MRLTNKVCVITGAGSGIGEQTALLFAREGASVLVADRNAEAAKRVAQEITATGRDAVESVVDVSSGEQVLAMLEHATHRYGRLDILVNNAGYGIPGTVVDIDERDWNSLMAVNVNGVFLGCKHAIPIMRRQGGGVIVNTASATAQVGITDRAAYVASKGAVAALTRAMALDHVHEGIRVNCVAPGTIESPYFARMFQTSPDAAAMKRDLEARQAMNRLGKPIEVAQAILFLASDESSFCTGTMLFVDGGWTAR